MRYPVSMVPSTQWPVRLPQPVAEKLDAWFADQELSRSRGILRLAAKAGVISEEEALSIRPMGYRGHQPKTSTFLAEWSGE